MNPFFNVGAVNGGTIPARIWGAFMQEALANLPPLNFTPPDESFWPFSSYISMQGRGQGAPPPPPTTTTVPVPTTVPAKKPTPTTRPKGGGPPTTKKPGGPPTTKKPGGP
jgi:membrane peptidoglycan carboxypeptidase